jgi:hypothetical protein
LASDKQNLESLKKYEIEGDTAGRWLRSKQIKHIFGISETTLQKLRRAKLLPFQRLGGTIFYGYLELTKGLTHKKTNEKD